MIETIAITLGIVGAVIFVGFILYLVILGQGMSR